MLNTASATPAWTRLLPTVKPSPRYGFIGGVIGNYWIITHGKLLLLLMHVLSVGEGVGVGSRMQAQ